MTYRYNKASVKQIPKDLQHERAKLIYQYRYIQKMKLEKIGIIFGLTKERTRQIIKEFKEGQERIKKST